MSALGLEGQVALVAGAGDGAVMRRLREEGMDLTQLELDPRDRAGSDHAIAEAIRARGGRLDLLVSIQAPPSDGSLQETSDAGFREHLERDLTAAFRLGRHCFGTLRERGGGSMIFVGSDAGIRAAHEAPVHSVASAGLIALAELFAAQGAPHGVRANAVCPRPGLDVAPVVAWLASPASAHVNGATLRVDDAAGAAMVVDTRI